MSHSIQEAEEKFMENRRKMEHRMSEFFQSCQEIGVGLSGFAEDVIEAVNAASDGEAVFDDWID